MWKKRIRVWDKALPVIVLIAGLAAVAVGSGIMGDNPVKVQEPITVESVFADAAEGVIYNDGLSFEVTAGTYPGDTYALKVVLKNHTSVTQVHRIVLDYPDGFRFAIPEGLGKQGTAIIPIPESPNALVILALPSADGSDSTSKVVIDVEVLPQMEPGWYTISGETEALETDLSNVG